MSRVNLRWRLSIFYPLSSVRNHSNILSLGAIWTRMGIIKALLSRRTCPGSNDNGDFPTDSIQVRRTVPERRRRPRKRVSRDTSTVWTVARYRIPAATRIARDCQRLWSTGDGSVPVSGGGDGSHPVDSTVFLHRAVRGVVTAGRVWVQPSG